MPEPAALPPPDDRPQGAPPAAPRRGALDLLERLGNALPEPALLFCLLAAAVAVLSAAAAAAGWTVQPVRPQVVAGATGAPEVTLAPAGAPIAPRSLLAAEGAYWALSSMLRNFTTLPALGLIFVAMLGIGLAEKFGFFGALMRALALKTPARLLSPMVVLIGANSSVASDAGYIVLPPEAPGTGQLVESPGARWSHVIVPIIFLVFLVPGLVFGRRMGLVTSQKDVVEGLHHGIRTLVPILVTAFFMAQFTNWFAYTHLDRMLAYSGGALLAQAHVPAPVLLSLFVGVVVLGDFAISGMLSKFGVLAPILIPMFMMVGISPEATTAAYRIGDSVVNIVTPLNPYLLVVLAVLLRYRKDAGLGSLIALMLPYSLALGIAWTALLLGWTLLGLDLGPAAPLLYLPPP